MGPSAAEKKKKNDVIVSAGVMSPDEGERVLGGGVSGKRT